MANDFYPSELTSPKPADFAAAAGYAWQQIVGSAAPAATIYLLTGHWGLETDWGRQMHCYNCGNIKATAAWTGGVCYYQAGENFDKTIWVDYYPRTYPGKGVVNRFRAYPTLQDGVNDFVQLLHNYNGMSAGDPATYAATLKASGYYNGDSTTYTNTLKSCFNNAQRVVGNPPPAPASTPFRTIASSGVDPDPNDPIQPRKYNEKVYWPYPARGDQQNNRSPSGGPCCKFCHGLFAKHNGFKEGGTTQPPLLTPTQSSQNQALAQSTATGAPKASVTPGTILLGQTSGPSPSGGGDSGSSGTNPTPPPSGGGDSGSSGTNPTPPPSGSGGDSGSSGTNPTPPPSGGGDSGAPPTGSS
jgi:hypothetical protein